MKSVYEIEKSLKDVSFAGLLQIIHTSRLYSITNVTLIQILPCQI